MTASGDETIWLRWSDLLGDLQRAWWLANREFADGLSEPSPARRDDTVLAGLRPEWSRHEGTAAGFDAVQMIDAASQYLGALKALIDAQTVALAPWPIARTIAEHVAHAAWLLERDIRPEARMARRWMAQLAAAYRYRWAAGAWKSYKAEEHDAKRALERAREELRSRFPDANTEWKSPTPSPPWKIAGETYPGLRKQSQAIDRIGVDGVAGLYDRLSLVTHPNPMALNASVDGTEVGGRTEFTYRQDPEQLRLVLRAASMLVYAAACAACNYFATSTGHLDTWYDNAIA